MERFFFFCVLCLWNQRAQCDPTPVTDHRPYHVKIGHNALLNCTTKPSVNLDNLTLEWIYNKTMQVFTFRNNKSDNINQDPKYKGRVHVFEKEMEKGNLSLVLTNVTADDEGNYSCKVRINNEHVYKANITLVVDSNGTGKRINGSKTTGAVIGGVIGGVIILALVVFLFIYFCRKDLMNGCKVNKKEDEHKRDDNNQQQDLQPQDEIELNPMLSENQGNGDDGDMGANASENQNPAGERSDTSHFLQDVLRKI